MNYTKGEWKVSETYFGDLFSHSIYAQTNNRTVSIAKVEGEANAHLIATAPMMYEALQSWEELWNMRPLDSGADMQEILERCWDKTEQALAKAEGKEE